MSFPLKSLVMKRIAKRMRFFIFILWSLLLTLIGARYYHRLRHIRLENSFCSGYQELKDGKCAARLSTCSKLEPDELRQMRQVLCGFRFDPSAQTDPPPPVPFNPYYYFHGYHGLDGIHGGYGGYGGYGGFGIHDFLGGYGLGQGYVYGHKHEKGKGALGYHKSDHKYHQKYFADVFEADIHQYRFVASIYSSDRKFLCGGALVSPKTVITSAQCVANSFQQQEKRKKRQEEEQTPDGEGGAEGGGEGGGNGGGNGGDNGGGKGGEPSGDGKLIIRFGEQYLNINPVFHKIYEYDVESVELHPNFDLMTNQNDIAVLRLVHPVPICLFPPILIPRKFEYWYDFDHLHGCSATYMGWGLKNQKPYFRAQTGQILPQYYCNKLFNWEPDQLHRSQLCVDSSTGVCITDTGGPLITHNKHGWVLVGLLTFGKHCRTPGLPLVFSRVTEAFDLVFKYIDQDFNSRNYTHIYPDECHHISHIHGPHHIPHHQFYAYSGPHIEKHEEVHHIHEKDILNEKHEGYGYDDHHSEGTVIHSIKKTETIPEIIIKGTNHPIDIKQFIGDSKNLDNSYGFGGVLPIKHINYEHLK